MRLLLLLLLILLPLLLTACDPGTVPDDPLSSEPQAGQGQYQRPPEYILAGIDGSGADVSRLRMTLDAIAAKCINDPREITEAIVEIKAILDRKGIEVTTLELMQRLEKNIPENDEGAGYDFTEVAASFRNLSVEPASR